MLLITLFLFSCNNNLKQNEENCKKLIEQRENILYYYSQYPNISEKLIKSTDSLILCNCIIKDTVKPEYPKYLKIGNNYKTKTEFLIELGSDGHEYAHNINTNYESYVCMHYIDCKKCKKDTL